MICFCSCHILYSCDITYCFLTQDVKEKNAAKAKLRRLCEDKAKHGEAPKLQVPAWLHKEWKQRDHLEMAMEYRDCGFDKEKFIKLRERTVTNEENHKSTVAVGWYSKEDMLKVLHWNAKKIAGAVKICEQDPLHLIRTEKGNCEYGGEEEYYVTTRETGALEQNRLKKDERKEITKDDSEEPMPEVKLDRLNKDKQRLLASQSSAAMRSKEIFTKHCDSVLQKTAKLRSLQSDLAKHYNNTDEVVRKSIKALDMDIGKLDDSYNKLTEVMAEGERDDYAGGCAKAVQNEAKIRPWNAKRHFKKIAKQEQD
ncbi:unnamed protein product [Cladocopium goreaui]|uniref:Uncharacterized protein n=1 Tax=Cladocopium goreaui TaxID=2562237 RepID=A0A9P1GPB3_9DINO|nr:unnamed protein product [Cladocopium goreaui]